jgi:hypothetical protein
MTPLSDTARAIQVLDQRYGKDGWYVAEPRLRQDSPGGPLKMGGFYRVYLTSDWRGMRYYTRGSTARDAILAAAGRVRAETREIAA